MANIIFTNFSLSTLRMRDSTTGNFSSSLRFEELSSNKSTLANIKNFAKNLYLVAALLGQAILSVMTFVEILSLLTVYFVPLLAIGIISLISKSFRNFVIRALQRITDTASNSIRIASLLLAIRFMLFGFRSIFGLGRAPVLLLQRIAEMDAIETIIAISLALASSVASVYSRAVNSVLAMFGLVRKTSVDRNEIQHTANEGHNAAWSFSGVIFSIVAAARFLPNMLFGLAGPAIVVGIGLAAAETIADSVDDIHEDADDQDYDDRTRTKGEPSAPLPPLHTISEQGNDPEFIPTAIPIGSYEQSQPETRWASYTAPPRVTERHYHHYEQPADFRFPFSGLFSGGWNRQPEVRQTQNVYVNTASPPTYSRGGSSSRSSWQLPASSRREQQSTSRTTPPPTTPTPTTNRTTHPLQEQRAIGFTSLFSGW